MSSMSTACSLVMGSPNLWISKAYDRVDLSRLRRTFNICNARVVAKISRKEKEIQKNNVDFKL